MRSATDELVDVLEPGEGASGRSKPGVWWAAVVGGGGGGGVGGGAIVTACPDVADDAG